MYTRIKNQKSGLKLLTNASTRAARLPLSSAASSLASSCASSATHSGTASAGDSPSSTSLSSSGCAATHMKHGFMNNASVSSSDSSATVCLDQSNGLNRLLSNMGMAIGEDVSPPPSSPFSTQPTTRIPFENQSSNIVNNSSSNSKNATTTTATKTQPQNKYTRSKKLNSASDEVNGFEEIGDINCILYVKSTWEKYAPEIDTEKGPSRLVIDENSQCPHLNGFVAFDLEHWWAERALDSIGEHSFSTTKSSNNPSSSSSKNLVNGNNNTTTFNANIASFNPSKPKSTISPLTGLNSFTIGFS